MVSDTEPRRKRRRAGLQALTTFYQQPRAAGPRLGEGYFRLILDYPKVISVGQCY